MIDLAANLSALLGDLLRSEWSGACPSILWQWGASALAHCFIAACLARLGALRIAWGFLCLLVAKDLGFDLPESGWSLAVMLDSGADLAFVVIAYRAFRAPRPQIKEAKA